MSIPCRRHTSVTWPGSMGPGSGIVGRPLGVPRSDTIWSKRGTAVVDAVTFKNRAVSDMTWNVCGIARGRNAQDPAPPTIVVPPVWNCSSPSNTTKSSSSSVWLCNGGPNPCGATNSTTLIDRRDIEPQVEQVRQNRARWCIGRESRSRVGTGGPDPLAGDQRIAFRYTRQRWNHVS